MATSTPDAATIRDMVAGIQVPREALHIDVDASRDPTVDAARNRNPDPAPAPPPPPAAGRKQPAPRAPAPVDAAIWDQADDGPDNPVLAARAESDAKYVAEWWRLRKEALATAGCGDGGGAAREEEERVWDGSWPPRREDEARAFVEMDRARRFGAGLRDVEPMGFGDVGGGREREMVGARGRVYPPGEGVPRRGEGVGKKWPQWWD